MNPITNKAEVDFPVAMEFTEALRQTVAQTLEDVLHKINAPKEAKDLVSALNNIAFYYEVASKTPEALTQNSADCEMIRSMVIEAVNAVANAGGMFSSPYGATQPREGTLLDEQMTVALCLDLPAQTR